MPFVIIEGLDRTAKSTLAKAYESQGYKYIHFSEIGRASCRERV